MATQQQGRAFVLCCNVSLALRRPAQRSNVSARTPPFGHPALLWLVLAAVTTAALSPAILFGLRQIGTVVAVQLSGPADVTDFLGYYGAAYLARFDPAHL